jgi:Secretion system C-terminal sorting domain
MNKKTLLTFLVGIIFTSSVIFMILLEKNKRMESEKSYKESSVGIPDDPNARMEFERQMLADPRTGMIPDNIREKELAFAKNLPNADNIKLLKGNNVSVLTWNQRGPINRGGRTRALGIDIRTQTAPSITIIAAGASGGIFKSTDNGTTWVNKLSPDSIHSATCIAQDTRSGFEDTWYIGTGERGSNLIGGGYNSSATLFLGDGIYKSIDNGEHWTLLPSTSNSHPEQYSQAFDFVFDITVNKATGSVFAAASNTIQRSTDGGATWSAVRGTLANNAYTDVQSTSTGVVYATLQSGVANAGLWRSIDDGTTWTSITPSTWPVSFGRTVMGIAPNNENVVYFWTFTGSGTTKTQLWKYSYPGSGNGAGDANWTNLTANLPAPTGSVAGIDVQSAYDMVVRVKPDDSLFVVIGGTNLYRSTDGFATPVSPTGSTGWIGGYAVANNVSQYANHHPDQHALVFLNSDPKVLYSGHDGGLSKTTDVTASSVTWSNLNNGYVTSQFYSIAIDRVSVNSNIIAGGMQDNGNYLTFSNNYNTNWIDWGHGGDGGFSAVADGNAAIYLEWQNGHLFRQTYDNNGNLLTDNSIVPSYSGSFAFINPFILDPNNNSIMYFAQGDSALRSNNVSSGTPTWSALTNATSDSTNDYITAVAVSKNIANRLYVGSSKGTVLRIDNANIGNPAATNLTSALNSAHVTAGTSTLGGYVNCIYVDPNNANNVIVVYSNYKVISLFNSTDGGTSWVNISGNLEQNADGSGSGPSVRWIDAITTGGVTTYYAATSTGLYSTNNISNGPTTQWALEGASTIGNVVCPMVAARSSDGLVVVATHGSGVFSANQTVVGVESNNSVIPTSFTLSQNYPNPFNPTTKINFTLPSPNNVKITVYDITGKRIADLLNQQLDAGSHTVDFNAANLASGTYIYRIQAGNFVEAKKMVLLK